MKFLSALVLGFCLFPTTKVLAQTPEPEGYRVVAHDAKTHEWTIIRTGTFDGGYQKKKLVVVCLSSIDANGQRTVGPYVCDLQVGQFMAEKMKLLDGNAPLLDISEMGDNLMIQRGTLKRHTTQVFLIKKIELLGHRP